MTRLGLTHARLLDGMAPAVDNATVVLDATGSPRYRGSSV